MNISRLLAVQSDFLTKGMPIIRYVLFGIIVLCAIILIVTILMQSEDSGDGMDVLTGGQESYYAQNKGSSRDGKLKLITTILAIVTFVCTILYFVTLFINGF